MMKLILILGGNEYQYVFILDLIFVKSSLACMCACLQGKCEVVSENRNDIVKVVASLFNQFEVILSGSGEKLSTQSRPLQWFCVLTIEREQFLRVTEDYDGLDLFCCQRIYAGNLHELHPEF